MERKHQLELLDSADIDSVDLHQNLRDIAQLNRFTRTTVSIVAAVERLVTRHPNSLSIIDIGTGAGDLPTTLTQWAARRHLPLAVYGADLHSGILDYARQSASATGWLRLDGTRLPLATRSMDISVTAVMAHHLEPDKLVCLMLEMRRVSRIGFVIMDLERSLVAHRALWLLTRLISRNPLTHHDGPLSIERAYTRAEIASLAAAAGISLKIEPLFPFRWLATWQAE